MSPSSLLVLLSQQVPGAASPAQGLHCLVQSPGQSFPLTSYILPLGWASVLRVVSMTPRFCASWLSHFLPPSTAYLPWPFQGHPLSLAPCSGSVLA